MHVNTLNVLKCSETIFAQAGLTNGSDHYTLPWSSSENITYLNSTSNSGEQGAWLFRINDFTPASLCSHGHIRLNLGFDYDYVYDYEDFNRQLVRGRVEFCNAQQWGTVCADQWNNADASVACAQLQFSRYGWYLHDYML